MALQTTALKRIFKYNTLALQDPGPQYTPIQVRDLYSATYPEINTAAIEGPEEKNGELLYTFRRAVGTKGSNKDLVGKPAELKTGAWRGLRMLLRKSDDLRPIEKSEVANLSYYELTAVSGLGSRSIRDINIWLAQDGSSLRDMPPKGASVITRKLRSAIRKLEIAMHGLQSFENLAQHELPLFPWKEFRENTDVVTQFRDALAKLHRQYPNGI